MVRMTGKTHPRAIFVPTASGDSLEYWEAFRSVYEADLGCDVDVLLVAGAAAPDGADEKISAADLVYVGGGNTKEMLETWRRKGVDVALRRAGETGTVLGGVSAGAICWFSYGNSDAPRFEGRTDVQTCRVDGLGFVEGTLCPHTVREEMRTGDFQEMMRDTPGVGLGVDDLCGIQISDSRYRVLSAGAGAGLHKVRWVGGEYRHEFVAAHDDWRDLPSLLTWQG
jgi:dipeptidase E